MMAKTNAKQDAKTRIGKFLAGDDVLLTSDEEKILQRWERAYDLIIKKEKTWVEIRDDIAFKFAVTKYTAENDMVAAQELFGINRKINKRFLMHLHLERIDKDYELARNRIFFYRDEDTGKLVERTSDAKELAALSRLADSYTYALNSIPVEDDRVKLPPPVFVFRLPEGVSFPVPELPQLLQAADNFIEYEMVQNGTGYIQPGGSANQRKSDAASPSDDQVNKGE